MYMDRADHQIGIPLGSMCEGQAGLVTQLPRGWHSCLSFFPCGGFRIITQSRAPLAPSICSENFSL